MPQRAHAVSAFPRYWLCGVGTLTVATACAACAPLTPAPPFHFSETAEVIRRGQVGVTAAGGWGTLGFGSAWGGAARVRVGIGHGQEVGIEGAAAAVSTSDSNGGTSASNRPWIGHSSAFGGKLSWKGAPACCLAAIVGIGATTSAVGPAVGGDVGIVLSAPWRVSPYAGFRGIFAVPVGDRPDPAYPGFTRGVVAAGGLAFGTSKARLFLEGGLLATSTDFSDADGRSGTRNHTGYYCVAGLGFVFGARR